MSFICINCILFWNLLIYIYFLFKEEKIKTKLNNIIRERKKKIYSSLTSTIEENMQECYESKIKRS